MPSRKQSLADLQARHPMEILALFARVSIEDLKGVVQDGRAARRASRTPRAPSTSSTPRALTGHALEMLVATLVRHLKDHDPTRSEDLREALGVSRENVSRRLPSR
jgi:hypothetical protein